MDLEEYETVTIGNEYYLVKKELLPFITKETKAAGIKVKNSKLSLEFAFLLTPYTTRNKVKINERGETLFLYGRDVFKKNIIKGDLAEKGEKLVVNLQNECLGVGYWNGEMLENVKDRGMFLRTMD